MVVAATSVARPLDHLVIVTRRAKVSRLTMHLTHSEREGQYGVTHQWPVAPTMPYKPCFHGNHHDKKGRRAIRTVTKQGTTKT